jgi:hypothetical protein
MRDAALCDGDKKGRRTMFEVFGPKPNLHEEDRIIDCEFAMELGFQLLAEAAERAHWTKDEVALALLSLSSNHIRATQAGSDTDGNIDLAKIARTRRVRKMFG